MPSRYKSRQRALQVLFQWEQGKIAPDQAIRNYYASLHSEEPALEPLAADPFMETLVHGTVGQIDQIDEQIARHAANWRIERMPSVDRNILRLATYEMATVGTPAAVVIDQALELAKRFSGRESPGFVNGVLDAIRRETA